NMVQAMEQYGSFLLPGSRQAAKSMVLVPLVAGDQARGLIALSDFEHERAYTDSDVRLLQTLANSMSVALENARLFEETQRLFKAEQQRVAELAIINSVQQALASQLDIQAIYEMVGDQVREIFDANTIVLATFDLEQNVMHRRYTYEKGERFFI